MTEAKTKLRTLASHRRVRALVVLFAALALLTGWLLASPHGSSPDDDFHLASTWCARGFVDERCEEGDLGAPRVPAALLEIACFKANASQDASCQADTFDWRHSPLVDAPHTNMVAGRPSLFYRAMTVFVGDNAFRSITLMRVANMAIAIAMFAVTFALATSRIRQALAGSWLVASVPLGLFLIPSTNTSSWSLVGVGVYWAALLTAMQSPPSRRRIAAAIVAAIAALMAIGSRSEGVALIAMSSLAVWLVHTNAEFSWLRSRRNICVAVGAVAAGSLAALLWLRRANITHLSAFAVGDFSSFGAFRGHQIGNAFFYNIVQLPSFWAGISGYRIGGRGALGWVDTPMPALVYVPMIAAFGALVFIGLGAMSRSKAIVLGGVFAALVVGPLGIFAIAGSIIPHDIQPRHFLGLFYLFAAFAILVGRNARTITLNRAQQWALIASTSIAHAVALHVNIRRYTSGLDRTWLIDLNTGMSWWWNSAPDPMTVWIVSSLAFVIVAVAALSTFDSPASSEDVHGRDVPLDTDAAPDGAKHGS